MPWAWRETSASDREWIYVYPRPTGITDVVYTIEILTDEGRWTASGVAHELVSTGDDWELWHGRCPRNAIQNAVFRLVITRR